MDNALHLIGIARKAGRVEVGEEPVGAAARAKQAKLIVLAADAADNTCRRGAHFAQVGNVTYVQSPYHKAQLGQMLGRSSCAILALTDAGLAASFLAKLARQDGERYGEASQTLTVKAEKVLRRQKEQRRHEKNLQRGKSRPWAAPSKEGARRTGKGTAPRPSRPKDGDQSRDHSAGKGRFEHKGSSRNGPGTGTKRDGGRQVT